MLRLNRLFLTFLIGILLGFSQTNITSADTEMMLMQQPNPCDTRNLRLDLSGAISDGGTLGTITNIGTETCVYSIGMASYEKFDELIDNQRLFSALSRQRRLVPGEQVELRINVPTCAAQIDLFYGEVLQSLDGGVRYGDRLLDAIHINGTNYCGAPGAVFVVNTHDDLDDGQCDTTHCSLREAIHYASGGDTINFELDTSVPIVVDYLILDKNLTIEGPLGVNPLVTITSNNDGAPIFIVNTIVIVTMRNLRLINSDNCGLNSYSCTSVNGAWGGAIDNDGITTVDNVVFEGNSALDGGAIHNSGSGTMSLTNVSFVNNYTPSGGAAIYNSGDVTISGCMMRDNVGGSIVGSYSFGGAMSITYCHFTNNRGAVISHDDTYPTAQFNVNFSYFEGNIGIAVHNSTSYIIDATNNYWGAPDGPSGAGTGSGDEISINVAYVPFIGDPADLPSASSVVATPLNSGGDNLGYEAQGAPDNVYGRVIMRNGQWMVAENALPQDLIDAGVIIAIDLYALNGATTNTDIGGYQLVCLAGSGRMIFLDATTSPRAQYEITDAYLEEGNTCGWVPNAGTVVLIEAE